MRAVVLKGGEIGLTLGAGVGVFHLATVFIAWQPWGPQTVSLLMLSTYAIMLAYLAALAILPFAIAAMIFRRMRSGAAVVLTATIVALVAMALLTLASLGVAASGVDRVVADSAPLVAAITRFEAEHHEAPATLDQLVPEYLQAVPGTGASAFPSFDYIAGSQDRPGRWWLSLAIGTIIFDFKYLEYDPDGRYPEWGTRLSGNWAVMDP